MLLRALSWRPWAALGMLAASSVAFAAAAVPPLWANAAADSLVSRGLATAGADALSVTLTLPANSDDLGVRRIPELARAEVEEAARLPAVLEPAFSTARVSLTTQARLALDRRGTRVLSPLAWHARGCERLVLVQGRCPVADTEVVLSVRTAHLLDASPGHTVVLPQLSDEPVSPGTAEPFPVRYTVVGLYSPPRTDRGYWAGTDAFTFVPADTYGSGTPARGDVVFGTASLLSRLDTTAEVVELRRILSLPHPDARDADLVLAELTAWVEDRRATRGHVTVDSPVLDTLTGLESERNAVRVASYLLGLQVLVLVCFVLFQVTQAATEARSNDLALTKLRGLSIRRILLVGFAEPLLVVALSAPIGLLLGWAVAWAGTEALLAEGTALRVDRNLLLGVLIALAGSCAATLLALLATLREPVLDQLRRASRSATGRRLVLGEVVVVVLAAVAIVEVSRGEPGEFSGVALLAPGLGALAIAVLTGRVLAVLAAVWARMTRHGADVAGFLASRQLSRRRGGTRVAVLITTAVSLAAFSAATWEVASRQRNDQAAMQVGAEHVYRVRAESAAAVVNAVAAADPTGKVLAAAAELPAADDRPGVVAVDATRLPAVATWRPEWSSRTLTALSAELRPTGAPSLTLRGRRIEVELDASVTGPAVALLMRLQDADGRASTASFGVLTSGRQRVSSQADQCVAGCELTAFDVVRAAGQTGTLIGSLDFHRLRVDGRPTKAFTDRAHWRPARHDPAAATSTLVGQVESITQGVRMRFNASTSQSPGMVRADVPETLPVVLATNTGLDPVGRDDLVFARTVSGDYVPGRVVGRTSVLPRLGPRGIAMDLSLANRFAPVLDADVGLQVWASPTAPPPRVVAERLREAGLTVLGWESRQQRAAALERGGAALAMLLLVATAVAALLVAALAAGTTVVAQSRQRAYEVAALAATGVPARWLQAASRREYALQTVAGCVGGLTSGVITASLAGAHLAGLGLTGPAAPTRADTAWAALTAVTLGSAVVFGLVTVAAGGIGRRLSAERLREGQA